MNKKFLKVIKMTSLAAMICAYGYEASAMNNVQSSSSGDCVNQNHMPCHICCAKKFTICLKALTSSEDQIGKKKCEDLWGDSCVNLCPRKVNKNKGLNVIK
jgi:hypothetical protein